jgi:hypothetical protein
VLGGFSGRSWSLCGRVDHIRRVCPMTDLYAFIELKSLLAVGATIFSRMRFDFADCFFGWFGVPLEVQELMG